MLFAGPPLTLSASAQAKMKKGDDYAMLKAAGLAVPIYGVFDASCLTDRAARATLSSCVEQILSGGSGLIGVRTEPKTDVSPLGNYPHYMPLRTFGEVIETIGGNERTKGEYQWWYLVNEAFLDYDWNAVVRVGQDGTMPGYWRLDGDDAEVTNLTALLSKQGYDIHVRT